MILYACTDPKGQEIAWGGSPSLALESASQTMQTSIADLERAGYRVAQSTIVPLTGGVLARAIIRARASRTPAQRKLDRLHALRWRALPVAIGLAAAVIAAAWAYLTGVPTR